MYFDICHLFHVLFTAYPSVHWIISSDNIKGNKTEYE